MNEKCVLRSDLRKSFLKSRFSKALLAKAAVKRLVEATRQKLVSQNGFSSSIRIDFVLFGLSKRKVRFCGSRG